jgi:hypothetical protein
LIIIADLGGFGKASGPVNSVSTRRKCPTGVDLSSRRVLQREEGSASLPGTADPSRQNTALVMTILPGKQRLLLTDNKQQFLLTDRMIHQRAYAQTALHHRPS